MPSELLEDHSKTLDTSINIGPIAKPNIPVIKNTTPMPAALFAVFGKTNIPKTIAAIMRIIAIPLGIPRLIEKRAVNALKPNVADSSKYVFFKTLFVSRTDSSAADTDLISIAIVSLPFQSDLRIY